MEKLDGLVTLMRPRHFVKNGVVFVPWLMTESFHGLPQLALTFVAFCIAASGVYSLNDVLDAEADALHPRKRERPIPSGQVGRTDAQAFAMALFAVASVLSLAVGTTLLVVIAVYIVLNIAYSSVLKELPLVDVTIVAFGFVLRYFAGETALGIEVDTLLTVGIFLVCLSFALGKRLAKLRNAEQAVLGGNNRMSDVYSEGVLRASMLCTSYIAMTCIAVFLLEPIGWSARAALSTVAVVSTALLLARVVEQMAFYDREPTGLFTRDRVVISNVGILAIMLSLQKVSSLV